MCCVIILILSYTTRVCFRNEYTMDIGRRFRRSGKYGSADGEKPIEKRKYHAYIIL